MDQGPLAGNSKLLKLPLLEIYCQCIHAENTPTLSMTLSTISWAMGLRVTNKRNENGRNKNFRGSAVSVVEISSE